MQYLNATSKKNDLNSFPLLNGKPFNITVIQDYAPTYDVKETEIDWFYEDLQHLLELIPKRISFSS